MILLKRTLKSWTADLSPKSKRRLNFSVAVTIIPLSTKQRLYTGDLKSGLIWISNGRKEVGVANCLDLEWVLKSRSPAI